MIKGKWICIAVLICLLTLSVNVYAQPETTESPKAKKPEQRQIKHVILVTVDGLNSKRLSSAFTPNLNGLAAQGIKTEAINVLPANYPTFAASLLTGASPDIHGFYGAGKQVKTQVLPEIILRYGHSASYVSKKGSIPSGLFAAKGELTVKNYEVTSGDNAELVNKAIKVFENSHPYFLGIRLSVNSGNGAAKGNSAKSIGELDNQIGKLFNTLMAYGVFDESLIITVGSYSTPQTMNGLARTGEDLNLPVIMAGPGIKSGTILPPVRVIDIIPTTALLCGLQISPESNGFILWNALASGTGFVEENLLNKRVKDLSDANIDSTKTIYSLLEEKRLVTVEKEKITAEKLKIRQTIDGKDRQIEKLQLRITLLTTGSIITVLLLLAGYVIEYLILRKRFLMF